MFRSSHSSTFVSTNCLPFHFLAASDVKCNALVENLKVAGVAVTVTLGSAGFFGPLFRFGFDFTMLGFCSGVGALPLFCCRCCGSASSSPAINSIGDDGCVCEPGSPAVEVSHLPVMYSTCAKAWLEFCLLVVSASLLANKRDHGAEQVHYPEAFLSQIHRTSNRGLPKLGHRINWIKYYIRHPISKGSIR